MSWNVSVWKWRSWNAEVSGGWNSAGTSLGVVLRIHAAYERPETRSRGRRFNEVQHTSSPPGWAEPAGRACWHHAVTKPITRIIIKSGTRSAMSLLGCNQMLIQFYVCVCSSLLLLSFRFNNSATVCGRNRQTCREGSCRLKEEGTQITFKYSLSGLVSFHPRTSPPFSSSCGSVSLSYGR